LIDRVDWIPKSERKEGIVLAMEMEWPSMFSLSATMDLHHMFIRYCCWDAAAVYNSYSLLLNRSLACKHHSSIFCLKVLWVGAPHVLFFAQIVAHHFKL